MTPFDLLVLAQDNPYKLKAHNDLVSCAVCCAGTIHVSRPLNNKFEKEKILYIDLTAIH